jgi:hypothetical protein
MKLLLCLECWDVFKLDLRFFRRCKCGRVTGQYIDSLHAEYSGDSAVPLGFNNASLASAVEHQTQHGPLGERFEAFVIQRQCPTFTKKDKLT